jgi:two-component system chemotaxis response regulator CheB
MTAPIKVLVVDDSAFARKVVREMLASATELDVVGTARDGEEALLLTESLKPDLVVTDLHMPRLNGVEFIRRQMRLRPLPILVISSASQDAAEVVDALNAGAFDVVQKPSALATDNLRDIRDELLGKIIAAAGALPQNLVVSELAARPVAPIAPHDSKFDIVVIGISTGGPQALRRMVPRLAANFPVPVAIVLHMPVGYTALYAEKLNELCALEVKEAADGDALVAGRVLLAQAGRHLGFRRSADGRVVAQLLVQPLEKIHRPSVDVLFQSAAEIYRARVLAVVMTGMGDDGREGAAWVKAQGGTVLTEDEKSCVIYGMPRSVKEAGLSDAVVSLDDMAQAICSRL